MPLSPQDDPQRAFRAGVLGQPFTGGRRAGGLSEDGLPLGPGESLVFAMHRLAGLSEPKGAFETGRALRLIAVLFDKAGAPPRVVEQFRDDLAAAVITHRLRRDGRPWGLADTVDMFLEMYRHIFGGGEADLAAIGAYLKARATMAAPPKPEPSGEGQAPFRHAA
ncbi:MAG: hypothetical protein KDG89_01510 [Geminicoccaceae bacterium]|nr:hypothetical protein [Geminicoccaceae bacterium]